MKINEKNDPYDDISQMIEEGAKTSKPASPEEMKQAFDILIDAREAAEAGDHGIQNYISRGSYKLDVVRDGSDEYFKALTDAILAVASGDHGSIDYKGYKIYYSYAPQISSVSLKDGHREYRYEFSIHCDALMSFLSEEYHSEEERKAFLDPESDTFEKTLAMLDKILNKLDEGKWLRQKETLNVYDFKDYSPDPRRFEHIEWDDRDKEASENLEFLLDDAILRAKGLEFTEDDFTVFADVIRRMVFFADYGKQNYLFQLQGFIWFSWKPKTKRDRYIWRCMDKFGQGDLPDSLLDSCSVYYYLYDPQGWEALACILPITALWHMCHDYEPDNVKEAMLMVFDLIPDGRYRERIEKMIKEDRAKFEKGESEYDSKND